MRHWAFIVAILYALMLGVLAIPFIFVSMPLENGGMTLKGIVDFYSLWQFWLWFGVMAVAQWALLAVPVRVARNRHVSRAPLALTVLAAAFMVGCLVAGAIFSLTEFAFGSDASDAKMGNFTVLAALGTGAVSWLGWAVVFYQAARPAMPETFVANLCRTMLKGSILELLVAVPTHIVARYRNYCCAGLMTFVGLATGTAVMLFSFGPAVYFLFVARWRQLHPMKVPPARQAGALAAQPTERSGNENQNEQPGNPS